MNNSIDVKEVHIFSDGAARQFKQKYTLSLLAVFECRYGVKSTWSFFATSHGKGVVDGIGATIKGAVWRKIRSGSNIETAEDFSTVAAGP